MLVLACCFRAKNKRSHNEASPNGWFEARERAHQTKSQLETELLLDKAEAETETGAGAGAGDGDGNKTSATQQSRKH